MKLSAVLATSLLLAAPLTGAQAQSADDYAGIAAYYGNSKYAVTITNITRGSSFTPVLVASHRPGVELFTLGQAASDELAAMAEGGDTMPLEDMLLNSGRLVGTGHSAGLLGPGESVTVEVPAGNANRISLAAMILPTNDGFIALNGVEVPRFGSQIYSVPGYDAGSEPNDELCASIPGPICGGAGGSPNANGEGFVHIHAGIHGIGDLSAADYDWRNPVATIKVERVRW